MATLLPARFTALRDEVFEALLEAIVSGRFPPGMRLIEAEIAQQLGVSKTPVREALVRLVRLGLVTYRPRRGTLVAEIGVEVVRDIFTLRWLIEGYVTAEATERASDADLADLERTVDAMAEAERDGNRLVMRDLDAKFHERIYELAGSPLFLEVWTTFRDQVRLWQRIGMRLSQVEPPWTVEELHREILKAMRTRSRSAAEHAAKVHIERATYLLGIGSFEANGTAPVDNSPHS